VLRHGDGVVAVALRASLSRDSLSDGELGIESAPAEKTPAPAVASVSVSDHASPADLTDLLRFLAAAVSVRRVPRQNALLSEHFNYHTHAHTHTHTLSYQLATYSQKLILYDPGILEYTLLTLHESRNKACCKPATSPVDRYMYAVSL